MRCVIVTGMSGAGKHTALSWFEDTGYFCVDNLPADLADAFAGIAGTYASGYRGVACCIDIRSGAPQEMIPELIPALQARGINTELLYLDADDHAIIRRHKETRRLHPLAGADRIAEGIREERKCMDGLRAQADHVIDTSRLLTRELQQLLRRIYSTDESYRGLNLTILSFGYKYGIPRDADLVFDVRFLPNPYYVEELRAMTGRDAPVREFVTDDEAASVFLEKLAGMLRFLVPRYIGEGKHQLVAAIGCTGGRHRSVAIAEALYAALSDMEGIGIRIEHRDCRTDAKRVCPRVRV